MPYTTLVRSPIWGKRDVWSIPKGELDEGEDLSQALAREFEEELGCKPPKGQFVDLGSAKQGSNKVNFIWAVEGDIDLTNFKSNTFSMEWPPKSGHMQDFPENDRAAWFEISEAQQKVFPAQAPFFDRLAQHLHIELAPPPEQQSLL